MSEEEIKEIIKILDKFITEHKLFNIKHSDGLEVAIEGIIDLYNKEKEKNEKLELENEELKEEKVKRSWVHIKENGEVEPLFYISEDKIKAKIEEYKKQQKEEPDAYLCIKVLQSLLEKE